MDHLYIFFNYLLYLCNFEFSVVWTTERRSNQTTLVYASILVCLLHFQDENSFIRQFHSTVWLRIANTVNTTTNESGIYSYPKVFKQMGWRPSCRCTCASESCSPCRSTRPSSGCCRCRQECRREAKRVFSAIPEKLTKKVSSEEQHESHFSLKVNNHYNTYSVRLLCIRFPTVTISLPSSMAQNALQSEIFVIRISNTDHVSLHFPLR